MDFVIPVSLLVLVYVVVRHIGLLGCLVIGSYPFLKQISGHFVSTKTDLLVHGCLEITEIENAWKEVVSDSPLLYIGRRHHYAQAGPVGSPAE